MFRKYDGYIFFFFTVFIPFRPTLPVSRGKWVILDIDS